MEDRCVCCGECVPEGRQVCWGCENSVVRGRRMTNLESNIFHEWQDLSGFNQEELDRVVKPFLKVYEDTVS